MQRLNLFSTLCLLFVSSMALANTESPVVVTINNRAIKLDEFNKRYDDARKLPNSPTSKKLFLEDLVRYEVGVQEAEKKNLAKDPIVAERIRQQLYVGLVEKELSDKVNNIKINESEMKDYYKKNPELRSSQILIQVKDGATDAERAIAKKRAEEILSEVKNSKKDFKDLAVLYSDDIVTKRQGGDVGFQTRIQIIPSYYEAILKLKVGQISSLIESRAGFHIAKLTGVNSYEDADKVKIRAALYETKRLALFNDYFSNLKKSYKIVSNPDAIK